MLDHEGIRKTFRQILLGVDNPLMVVAGRIAWENAKFSPPDPALDDPKGCLWLRETYLIVTEKQPAYGYLELTAIMQYDVFGPAGGGTEKPARLAKIIGDTFGPGTGLVAIGPSGEPVQISLIRAEPGNGNESAYGGHVWYMIPVRITFRAYGLTPRFNEGG